MGKISFLMAIHNHQPCDNFGWVFDEAYEKSYKPFMDVLEKFPDIKVAMHYSGSLLEWLYEKKPDFIERIKSLVKKRQIELLTGGFYEPILPMIPDEDKKGQVEKLTDFIKKRFEYVPQGAWITERVWDENLADLYKGAGIQYSILDENHFKCAGIKEMPINGHYKICNGFNVFGVDKKLRYMMPFADVKEIFAYLGSLSEKLNDTCIVFADDGEKFGLWPSTYESVYKKGWLEAFFTELSKNENKIRSESFSSALSNLPDKGEVDIPPCSYSEMMEWSEGDFNNFFKKYPEANIMRKRMISVSNLVNTACRRSLSTRRQKDAFDSAKNELYKSQSGCAYWHGIFGGFYLNHLRAGVYKHLIKAQKLIEDVSVTSPIKVIECDLDDDGRDEIIVGNKHLDLYIKPDHRGSVFGLDDKLASKNMINVLSRSPEPYHRKIWAPKKEKISVKKIKESIKDGTYFNIHDVLGIKDKRLKKYLIYDEGRKDCLIDYFIAGKFTINDFAISKYENLYEVSKNEYSLKRQIDEFQASFIMQKEEEFKAGKRFFAISIKKKISIADKPGFNVEYSLKNISGKKIDSIFAIEFNWSVMDKELTRKRDFRALKSFEINDQWDNSRIKFDFMQKTRLWTIPIYTVNESEAGLEKTYQYLRCLTQNPVVLDPDDEVKFGFNITITVR